MKYYFISKKELTNSYVIILRGQRGTNQEAKKPQKGSREQRF